MFLEGGSFATARMAHTCFPPCSPHWHALSLYSAQSPEPRPHLVRIVTLVFDSPNRKADCINLTLNAPNRNHDGQVKNENGHSETRRPKGPPTEDNQEGLENQGDCCEERQPPAPSFHGLKAGAVWHRIASGNYLFNFSASLGCRSLGGAPEPGSSPRRNPAREVSWFAQDTREGRA